MDFFRVQIFSNALWPNVESSLLQVLTEVEVQEVEEFGVGPRP